MIKSNAPILVLGSRGLVGSAITRELKRSEHTNLLLPSFEELDLSKQQAVLDYFKKHEPEYVILAAAKVGGIHANNTYRADFIFQNLSIEINVFQAAFESRVKRMLFLGSSCIYPRECPQPIKEEYLLTGPLEPTNEPYAIAKIAGLKMAESFRRQHGCDYFSAMPTNLFGPGDNYDEKNAHVIPGLIARMARAIREKNETFEVWGSGRPRREFLFVDDLAKACVFLLKHNGWVPDLINIGTGEDIAISELAQLIGKKMGFNGKIVFDPKYPDGTMRKLLDVSKIKSLGWKPTVTLDHGLDIAIEWYRKNIEQKA
jgi:GDP-L-fucose synthase